MTREKELRNFFGNVVSTLRETEKAIAARSADSSSSERWQPTRWEVRCQQLSCLLMSTAKQSAKQSAACDHCLTFTAAARSCTGGWRRRTRAPNAFRGHEPYN